MSLEEQALAHAVKGTSWTDLIVAIPAGEEERFPLANRNTIAPLISGRIKLMYPERVFETSKNGEVLIVKRTA